MPLTSNLFARPGFTYTRTRNGAVQTWLSPFGGATIDLGTGTGTNQANIVYDSQRTLAASGTEELDLAGDATLLDAFAVALTFVKVKYLYVRAASGNTNNVVLGGAAANAFVGPFVDATDKMSIPPNGLFFVVAPGAGWTVTAGTGDKLLIANSGAGTPVTYDIVIGGTDA